MPDEFVPLVTWLSRAQHSEDTVAEEAAETIVDTVLPEQTEIAEVALADVRRFRAALADALEASVNDLVADIAADVVARELLLAPADLCNVVARARERFRFDEPVAIHVHPCDMHPALERLGNVVADSALRRGDVVVRIASGSIDASLGVRLDRAISAAQTR